MSDPMASVEALWHYTCEHGDRAIVETAYRAGSVGPGLIKPGADGLLWATDLDAAGGSGMVDSMLRDALGLTSHSLACDRMAYRWRLDDLSVVAYFRPWVEVRRVIDPARRAAVEAAPGVLLRHWFVSMTPVWGERA